MAVTTDGDKIIPQGGTKKRYGKAKKGIELDDLVTVGQLAEYLNGELVTSVGLFGTLDSNRAIKIKTSTGDVYLPILSYP